MATKKQTKAQLQQVIEQLQKDLATAQGTKDNQQTLIEQNAHDIKFLKAKITEADECYSSLKSSYEASIQDRQRLEKTNSQLVTAHREMETDRDKWRTTFLEEQQAKRKARELFVRQAHLAGELAELTTSVALKHG